ncbi:DUF6861 domain-containing protein [Ideonella sp. A 288]|uniref:DUF6861 domain-containing protein n=1 Tax=Ideonella sp. A 288 TaxID=1962181 RepID=UPI000B4B6B37|nr:hypothetical protein [Ideonella sp. A 288]
MTDERHSGGAGADRLHRQQPFWQALHELEDQLSRDDALGHFAEAAYDSLGAAIHWTPVPYGTEESSSRLGRLRQAFDEADNEAWRRIAADFSAIDIGVVWPILIGLVKDIAMYVGGGAVGGGVLGAIGGFFLGGVGAIPGAAAGASAGAGIGAAVMNWMGLASLAQDLAKAIPEAAGHYVSGFRMAWGGGAQRGEGPLGHSGLARAGRGPEAVRAATMEIATGHVLLVTALLMAVMAYLTRGKGNRQTLLSEIRNSRQLGPKVAQWVEANEGKFGTQMAMIEGKGRSGGGGAKRTSGPAQTPRQLAGRVDDAPPPRTKMAATVLSRAEAEAVLVKNGLSPARAKDYVASFDGPITLREIDKGETFLRYADDPSSKGSFLTNKAFGSPKEAAEALYLGPYGNQASLVQQVTATKATTVLEGAIANGVPPGTVQTLMVDRTAFSIGTGVPFP